MKPPEEFAKEAIDVFYNNDFEDQELRKSTAKECSIIMVKNMIVAIKQLDVMYLEQVLEKLTNPTIKP